MDTGPSFAQGADDDGGLQGLIHPELAPIFWPFERIDAPSAWWGHIPFARWLVGVAAPRLLVELGTHAGVSYTAFCQAVQETGLDTQCYAVDTWQGDAHSELYDEGVFREFREFHDERYAGFSSLLRMTFDEALQQFNEGTIDLLHIDGFHTYDAVKHDFESWVPKLSRRAVVLFHDTVERGRDFGVWRLWSELKDRFPSFEFRHGHGLGVLAVGARAPTAVLHLCQTTDAPKVTVLRGRFITAAQAILARVSERALLQDLSGRQAALQEATAQIAELQDALRRADVSAREAVISLEQEANRTAKAVRANDVTREALLRSSQLVAQAVARAAQAERLAQTAMAERDQAVGERDHAFRERDALTSSTMWRSTWPIRASFSRVPPSVRRAMRGSAKVAWWTASLKLRRKLEERRALLAMFGREAGGLGAGEPPNSSAENLPVPATAHAVLTKFDTDESRYAAWIERNQATREADRLLRDRLLHVGGRLPLISVVMPVHKTPLQLLDRAIESVCNQIFPRWELCIADDCSGQPELRAHLERWAALDPRIRVEFRSERGNISAASNTAAALATGEYLAFLDHDDELAPDALAWVALAVAEQPDADCLYSDDDKIDLDGRRFAPQFKPDWSPVLLLSYMYMSHLLVVRRSLFLELEGFRLGFEGSQDYDFALRMSERARQIVHLPRVLYHWRVTPHSTAASGGNKPESFEAGRRAVAEALQRRGMQAQVEQPGWAARSQLGIFAPSFSDDGPRVAILIPTKNQLGLLKQCIKSLEATTYQHYEIVVVDNDSDDPATVQWLSSLACRVLRIPNPEGGRFSFAHLLNSAVRAVDAEYVLLLNNDTEVRSPRWLSQMMGYAQLSGVGAVGARLLFPNRTINHAGVVHGLYDGMAGPAFRGAPDWDLGYLCYAKVAREYSAVTAACLLTPRALYLDLGGLDETEFPVAYNDVDYCYRLVNSGRLCVYCSDAELIHHEGTTRGFVDDPMELANFRRRYYSRVDPWYNPNLSLDDEQFRVIPYHAPIGGGRPVRAIMVSHNLNHEGAPNSMFEMAVGLKRREVVDPVIMSPADGPLRARYEAEGIKVEIIPSPLSDVHTATVFENRIAELAALFQRHEAEVVYGNTAANFWVLTAAQQAKVPSIWNIRESEPWETYFDYMAEELRSYAYQSFALPYRIIFVAHATRKLWEPLNTKYNFLVIRNGLDADRLPSRASAIERAGARATLDVRSGEIVAVLVGTVCERKGQIDIVRAFGALPATARDRLRVFIVGDRDSDYSRALHSELATLPPSDRERITVVPETDQVPMFYAAADLALCASRAESYPRIILEAMACGLPLVTTPVYGIREQVVENVNALFYDPGEPATMALQIARLVEDDDLRAHFSRNSQFVLGGLPGYEEMLDRYGRAFQEARGSFAEI